MMTTIGNLFNVFYGQKEYENKQDLESGDGILISSKGEDNGVYGLFDIKDNYKAPFITVPRTGTIGQAFVQLLDCSVDNNCLVLLPKEELNKEVLLQVALQIRMIKWKYRYGRQITPDRIKSEKIQINELRIEFNKELNNLIPKHKQKENIIENKDIRFEKISDLCYVSKKTATPQDSISQEGNIPYISSSSKENGMVFFTDEEANFKGGVLTVAKDGNDGYSFFQPFDFITSLHNYVLTPKKGNTFLLLYVGAIIKKFSYCYNHYLPLSPHRLNNMKIPIPYNGDRIDLDYIEKIVKNSYGFNEIKEYIENE